MFTCLVAGHCTQEGFVDVQTNSAKARSMLGYFILSCRQARLWGRRRSQGPKGPADRVGQLSLTQNSWKAVNADSELTHL